MSVGTKHSAATVVKFALPSAVGIMLLLVPVPSEGVLKIPMGALADAIQAKFEATLPAIVVGVCVVSAIATLAYALTDKRNDRTTTERLLRPEWAWTLLRILGALTAVAIFYQIGPDWVWGENTGGAVINDLFVPALVIIGIACIILPLVTEFGLMEFIGVLVERPFQALFKVPGRSAIDAVASWLGGSAVGIIVTADQYEKGHYSAREAAVIATNFSIVSIAFCYVVVATVSLEEFFLEFYLTLTLTGIICAMIMARIPPLSLKPDTYMVQGAALHRDAPREFSFSMAFDAALTKASNAPPIAKMGRSIWVNILDIWLGLIPAGVFIATIALGVAEYTSFFEVISQPIVWLLDIIGVHHSTEAAPALLAGFAEVFLPALMIQDVPTMATRFIVAVVSVGQLIFMSEVGILMLKSCLPLNLFDLVVIFLLRTLILLPLAVLSAAVIF